MVRFRSEMIPLLRLHRLFDLEDARTDVGDNVAVVVERNGEMFALLVEELLGQQQIVIKSLGADLANADTVAGAAVLGDGSVGLILDVDGMIALAEAARAA
jgi:two-component system chemotaxis sensor kinase CheA